MPVKLTTKQLRAVQAQVQLPLQPRPVEDLTLRLPMRARGAARASASDRWARSEAVARDYAWRDELRTRAGITLGTKWADARELHIVATFATRLEALFGQPYREAPDFDNIEKAVADALLVDDRGIWRSSCEKVWGPADELVITLVGLRR